MTDTASARQRGTSMSQDETTLAALDRYIDDHLDESLADLTRLTAIPSVSSKG